MKHEGAFGEGVDVWGFGVLAAVEGEVVVGAVVGDNYKDVWWGGVGIKVRRDDAEEEGKEE